MGFSFNRYDMPVAASMVELAKRAARTGGPLHPFQEYMCYWTAFNNIYATVTYMLGHATELTSNPDGSIVMRTVGGLEQATFKKPPDERRQIQYAVNQFDDDLVRRLLKHRSTGFFVYRAPKWKENVIRHDILRQRLNGVINVNYTVSKAYPIWTHIDTQKYERYIAGNTSRALRLSLTKQVVAVLYTVRNNLYHGGKRADDANDIEVVENALPLLQMIVAYFISL